MKKASIISLLLFMSSGLQSMESEQCALEANINSLVTQCFNDQQWDIELLLEKSVWATGSEAAAKKAIKEYCDAKGNTIAHLLVTHKQSDSLFACAKRNLISLKENNKSVTPIDVALLNFSTYISGGELQKENGFLSISQKTGCCFSSIRPQREKCCYYILFNYKQSQKIKTWYELCCHSDDFKYCCSHHNFSRYS